MAIKKKSTKPAGGGLGKVIKKTAKAIGIDGRVVPTRRARGPSYWANKVLVQKLKTKYNRLKYGSIR